jgi:hypothetical protein
MDIVRLGTFVGTSTSNLNSHLPQTYPRMFYMPFCIGDEQPPTRPDHQALIAGQCLGVPSFRQSVGHFLLLTGTVMNQKVSTTARLLDGRR